MTSARKGRYEIATAAPEKNSALDAAVVSEELGRDEAEACPVLYAIPARAPGRATDKLRPEAMIAYQDPDHEGNSAQHHSGKPCHTRGCKEPAGTAWSPLWCFKHNVERMDRISASLDDFAERAKFSALVDKACSDWRRTVGNLLNERNAILRAAGGKVTATKEQHRDSKHWSHQSHRDGSETYQIDV